MAQPQDGRGRRTPRQARSRATWEAIVEAAAQILERDGPAGFNTNAVAERAGVSIGTLYQYFPNKAAILVAAAEREARRTEPGFLGRQKALLRALVAMLEHLGGGVAATTRGAGHGPGRPPAAKIEPDERRIWNGWLIPLPLA